MAVVDAHHHFWKIDLGIYDWISDDISGIRRDYQPEHLKPYLTHLGIEKTVLVQAGESLLENEAMLHVARDIPFVAGIVAWVDLEDDGVAAELNKLANEPKIKSIRPVLQGIEDSDWILRPAVLENLKLLPDLGLCFDALIQPRHLEIIGKLSDTIPDLQIVIDHAAKPVISGKNSPDADWEHGMAKLAERHQIFCKLSGLATEMGPGWSAEKLQPVSQHLLGTFGPERLMWGSDWPVLELDGSYIQWHTAAEELLSDFSPGDKAEVMGGTATRFYNL